MDRPEVPEDVAFDLVEKPRLKAWLIQNGIDPDAMGFAGINSMQAFQFAFCGYTATKTAEIDEKLRLLKPKRGRPKVDIYESVDALRAASLLNFARNLGERIVYKRNLDPSEPVKITAREMIRLAQIVEKSTGETPLFPVTTSLETLERSVSIGRRSLGIGRHWETKT